VYLRDHQPPHSPNVQVVCRENHLAALPHDSPRPVTRFDSRQEAIQEGNRRAVLNGQNDVAMSDRKVQILLPQHSQEKAL
jgi:hypothetical protein